MKLRGSVYFESKWSLQITAGVISDQLLSSVAFSDEIPGLRDEVPAVALTKELFGLTFVLYGECVGEQSSFVMEALPGKAVYDQFQAESKTIDIGHWLAQMVETIPEFKVTGWSPVE